MCLFCVSFFVFDQFCIFCIVCYITKPSTICSSWLLASIHNYRNASNPRSLFRTKVLRLPMTNFVFCLFPLLDIFVFLPTIKTYRYSFFSGVFLCLLILVITSIKFIHLGLVQRSSRTAISLV